MRMMKRVAVSILAAAMALSLMTACGGGDAPSAPETPSNPGTSQGEEKKDDEKKDPPAESKPTLTTVFATEAGNTINKE